METFNEKIKRLRKSKGLNQSDVCSEIGITQPSFASIESGKTKSISIELGKKLAKSLSISFNDLFEIETLDDKDGLTIENAKLKKRIIELEVQLQDKSQLEEYFKRDILQLKSLILSWSAEYYLTEEQSLKSFLNETKIDIIEYEKRKSELTEMIVKHISLFIKNKVISINDFEKEFDTEQLKPIILKVANLV